MMPSIDGRRGSTIEAPRSGALAHRNSREDNHEQALGNQALVAAAATAVALGFSAPAFAQQKVVLKSSDVHPFGYPTVEAVKAMGEKLDKATNGRLTVQIYPSMQLGGEKEMIEQAQVGALAMARVSVGPMGPIVDDLNVFNMPFVFRSVAHMHKVVDGPIGQEMLDKITNNPKTGLVGLCWMDGGARNIYNSKRPVKTVPISRD